MSTPKPQGPPPSQFVALLEPMFRLGPEHPIPLAVLAALEGEWAELTARASDLQTQGESRAWWCGGSMAVRVLADELRTELARRKLHGETSEGR